MDYSFLVYSIFYNAKLMPIPMQIYGKTLTIGRFSPIFFTFALIFILHFHLIAHLLWNI